MFDAALWGLVQGLTEFLPISSSGHLVLVPAFLGEEPPGIGVTAVLHLGTLAAVVAYYRRDLVHLARTHRKPESRRILVLLALGTVPAVIAGLLLADTLDELFDDPFLVGIALILTGVVLLASSFIVGRTRRLEQGKVADAVTVGLAQASALIPGISRSGMTITAGLGRGFDRTESARFSFLLAIPVIAGAGLFEALELADSGGFDAATLVGVVVAAVSGYLAIAFLLRILTRYGLRPFAGYCFVVGVAALIRF